MLDNQLRNFDKMMNKCLSERYASLATRIAWSINLTLFFILLEQSEQAQIIPRPILDSVILKAPAHSTSAFER